MADGVWRTISGRRVFIGEGQSLTEAMKSSGKFEEQNGQNGVEDKFAKDYNLKPKLVNGENELDDEGNVIYIDSDGKEVVEGKRGKPINPKKSLSTLFKEAKEKDKDFFFGEGNHQNLSNKYFEYKSVLNDEEIILRTNNIRYIKGNPVLVVGNNEAVYVKEFNLRTASDYKETGTTFHLAKLNKNYFKKYTFKQNIDNNLSFDKSDSFESLFKVAQEQEKIKMSVRLGD